MRARTRAWVRVRVRARECVCVCVCVRGRRVGSAGGGGGVLGRELLVCRVEALVHRRDARPVTPAHLYDEQPSCRSQPRSERAARGEAAPPCSPTKRGRAELPTSPPTAYIPSPLGGVSSSVQLTDKLVVAHDHCRLIVCVDVVVVPFLGEYLSKPSFGIVRLVEEVVPPVAKVVLLFGGRG